MLECNGPNLCVLKTPLHFYFASLNGAFKWRAVLGDLPVCTAACPRSKVKTFVLKQFLSFCDLLFYFDGFVYFIHEAATGNFLVRSEWAQHKLQFLKLELDIGAALEALDQRGNLLYSLDRTGLLACLFLGEKGRPPQIVKKTFLGQPRQQAGDPPLATFCAVKACQEYLVVADRQGVRLVDRARLSQLDLAQTAGSSCEPDGALGVRVLELGKARPTFVLTFGLGRLKDFQAQTEHRLEFWNIHKDRLHRLGAGLKFQFPLVNDVVSLGDRFCVFGRNHGLQKTAEDFLYLFNFNYA